MSYLNGVSNNPFPVKVIIGYYVSFPSWGVNEVSDIK